MLDDRHLKIVILIEFKQGFKGKNIFNTIIITQSRLIIVVW